MHVKLDLPVCAVQKKCNDKEVRIHRHNKSMETCAIVVYIRYYVYIHAFAFL